MIERSVGLTVLNKTSKSERRHSMGKTMEIYFRDLNEDTQKAVLDFYGLETPEDGNYDVFPVCVLEYEDESLEDTESEQG